MKTLFRGQISITVATITAAGMIVASVFTSWATSSANISSVKEQTSIVQEREQNHYSEVQKRLDSIDGKIDRLLQRGETITAIP